MFKHLFKALICLSFLLPSPSKSAQIQQFEMWQVRGFASALLASTQMQELGAQALADCRDLRTLTSRQAVDAATDGIVRLAGAISQECRLFDESLGQSLDDPRLDLQEIRLLNTQIDANARFAAMAARDLLHALDTQAYDLRTRALREMEGGFRFIRFAAAELSISLRELDHLSP